MIHPIRSVIYRYKKYNMDNFQKTSYSKELKQFKNLHKNETCFIVGNGPSLTVEDINRISSKHYVTFAFNRIYLLFNKTSWRPDYYISQDDKILKQSKSEIDLLSLNNKFIPLNLKYFYNTKIKDALYFKLVNRPSLSEDISIEITNSNTVAVTAIQIAVYMGFKRIVLIGIDHNFSVYVDKNGTIIKDSSVKDYFSGEYNKDQSELYIPNLGKSTNDYVLARDFCEKKGVEVFNATRGGKLEVFQRLDLDVLLDAKKL